MQRIFTGVFVFVSITMCIYADQQNSIVNEIANYNLSGEQFLNRAHNLITDCLRTDNFSKIDSVLVYLQKYYTDAEIYGNDKNEYLLLLWINNYDELLKLCPYQIDRFIPYFWSRSYPEEYSLLWSLLFEKTKENKQFLIDKINNSNLRRIQQDYVILLLEYYLYGSYDDFNHKATEFLLNYPDSEFDEKIRNLREIYKIINTGVIIGCYINFGSLTGNLEKSFGNHHGLGCCFDIIKNNFTIHLNLDLDISKIKRDIGSSDVWEKGKSASLMKYGIGVGYPFQILNKIRIIPNAGIAGMQFSASEGEDKNTKHISLYPGYTLGCIIDFLIRRKEVYSYNVSDHCIRFRVHYQNPNWQIQGNEFDGASLVFSVGYVWFSNNKERIF